MFSFKKLQIPVIQAPMAGGITTQSLVAAVANAGGIGSFGFAYDPPDKIDRSLSGIRRLTRGMVNANFFIFDSTSLPTLYSRKRAIATLRGLNYARDQIPDDIKVPFSQNLDDQLHPIWHHRPNILTFHLGVPKKRIIDKAKSMGICVGITATSLEEAQKIKNVGADFVVAQGVEAGGHRGVFDQKSFDQRLSMTTLVKTIQRNVVIPVVGAGGIMNGGDIKITLREGAIAAQMGTAFLCCRESGAPPSYKEYLLAKRSRKVVFTKSFSGRLAQGIENEFIKRMDSKPILPFPAQNVLTSGLRKFSAINDNGEYQSLWAGRGFVQMRRMSAKGLMSILKKEMGIDS